MQPEIKVLLFDLGGVLIRPNDPVSTFGMTHSGDQFLKSWILSPAVRDYERGAIEAHEFARRIVTEADLPYTPDEFLQRFDGWPDSVVAGAPELLRAIPGNYRKAILSNTNQRHWGRDELSAPLVPYFDEVFLSFQTGLLKPDAEAFENVVNTMGCRPGEVMFFDDNALNVEGAERFGCKALLVDDFSTLRDWFSDRGISGDTTV